MFFSKYRFIFRKKSQTSLPLPLPMVISQEKSIFSAFREGEASAFSTLYERNRKAVLKWVQRAVRTEEVALELTQEIFLKVYRFRDRYDDRLPFAPWLWTIVRNTVSEYFRGGTSRASQDGWADADGCAIEDRVACPAQNAEALVISNDMQRVLKVRMGTLSALQRKVLQLRLVQQLPYQEIAHALGLSLAAVKNLVYRAKRSLSDGDQHSTLSVSG